eukprot:jgi/Psemu1/146346/gw1.34.111.1
MQRDKTIQFWDDYHDEKDSEEWISTPGKELLEMISDQVALSTVVSILEIGCGTSTLVRDLKWHIEERDPRTTVIACGSDVSRVCIDANRKRDCPCPNDGTECSSNNNGNDNDNDNDNNNNAGEPSRRNWDVIVDKGCLDTFLFRSRQRGAQNKIYPESLRIVLDKIHGNRSRYIFVSPRSKIKAVRDYAGFASVRKYPLPGICRSQLEGKKGNINISINIGSGGGAENTFSPGNESVVASPGYMFVCTKNDAYRPGISQAFSCDNKSNNNSNSSNNSNSNNSNDATVPTDDSRCPRCPLTFRDFRKAEQMDHRGVNYWTRRWKAHGLHC